MFIYFWLLAWFFGGTPAVEPWNTWFAFLIAASVATFAHAHKHRTAILWPVSPQAQFDQDEDDD